MDTVIKARKRLVDWLGQADCSACALGGEAVCQDLPRARRDGAPAPIDQLTYGAHMALYSEGDAAPYVFAVRDGLLKMTQLAGNGTRRIVRFLQAGQMAGLEALGGGPYRHTVETIRPTLVCRIPVAVLKEGAGNGMALSPRLFQLWLRSLDDADKIIRQLSTGASPGRVVRFLLYALSGPDDDSCVALSREDMSAVLSVAMETVSRTIADLKRQGLLREVNGRFHFNRAGLLPLAAE